MSVEFLKMSVDFFEDSAREFRWRISDGSDILHSCHEGFSSKHNALQNLFLNHAMISMFVAEAAGSDNNTPGRVRFFDGSNGEVWWNLRAANGEIIGKSHKGFKNKSEALDNLVKTYTFLALFVARNAQDSLK